MKILLFLCCFPLVVNGQIFDDPKNLKVLDKEISPVALRETMKSFSQSLGVRCHHCHVGEEGQPLTKFDFAADEKETKEKARLMLKMVSDINNQLSQGIKDRSVQVECITCHRGAAKPIQTVDLLDKKFKEEGVDATIAYHDELKSQFFGSHTYDFTENTLLNLAQKIHKTDKDASLKLLHKNITLHPESSQTLFYLGESYMDRKDPVKALEYYEKTYQLQPNPWLEKKIKEIKQTD